MWIKPAKTAVGTRRRSRPFGTARETATTLVEYLIVMGVISILVVATINLFSSSSQQMALMLNYCDMNGASQSAMDTITRDIRKANRVISCTTNTLQLEDEDGIALTYTFNAVTGTLTKSKSAAGKTLLTGCEAVTFTLGRRNPGTFWSFPSSAAECKVVNVSWKCSRFLLGNKQTTENMMTATVVIRRQGT